MGNGFVAWFSRSYKGIIVVLLAIMAAALVALAMQHVSSSQAASGRAPRPAPTFSSTATVERFAVVGDSVTAANSPDIDNGQAGDASWAYYANRDGARLVGGWALGGATTEAMNAAVKPYQADTLVILAGTNDSGQGVPFDTTAANLRSIVDKAGIDRVIVSSIPPRNAAPATAAAYNTKLKQLSESAGWTFVDAAAALREGDTYRDGFTADGIHPTAEGAKALGGALHDAIVN
ncbi:SGNH/GDSL hydrolase family protein [Curtobacterium sp. MCBA15_004]|uniref:SGNH/GDSL hydrolase family protein n=1 Tax=Curtobacterium sp. MCBA15_004 TaxID=1898733 RepID=UPI0008DD858D|nr:SGNH/GDSL hydrolase family protein [Curtobacterium sp. MCBA15_004]WIA96397.1 SGNH/GDSL hydrolase family protein [Curtobacterium sp. MCBA15_004]